MLGILLADLYELYLQWQEGFDNAKWPYLVPRGYTADQLVHQPEEPKTDTVPGHFTQSVHVLRNGQGLIPAQHYHAQGNWPAVNNLGATAPSVVLNLQYEYWLGSHSYYYAWYMRSGAEASTPWHRTPPYGPVWPAIPIPAQPVPPELPQIDPMTQPIPGPAIAPRPLPWHAIPGRPVNRPDRVPGERPERGPVPVAPPGAPNVPGAPGTPGLPIPVIPVFPGPGVSPVPSPRPLPETRPVTNAPAVRLTPTGAKPTTGVENPRSPPRPPRGNVRERKIRLIASVPGAGVALKLINWATEGFDFVDALWKALPKSSRTPNANPAQKLEDLWDHMDELDLEQAIENIVNENLQDIVVGRSGRAAGQAGAQLGSKFGVGIGPALDGSFPGYSRPIIPGT